MPSSNMIDDDFFSDDDSDGGSVTFEMEDDSKNFGTLYEHKQVETLKFLRLTLNENKILKRRLHMVENELERYQDFKSILPAEDRPDSNQSINDDFLLTTDDKECQTEGVYEEPKPIKPKTPTPVQTPIPKTPPVIIVSENSDVKSVISAKSVESLTMVTDINESSPEKEDDSELEQYQMPEVIKFDKEVQCDPEIVAIEKSDSNLSAAMEGLMREKKMLNEQIEGFHQKIKDLKHNNKSLMEKYDAMMTSHELTNELLNESKCEIEVLKETNAQLEDFKSRVGLIEVENNELRERIVRNDTHVNSKNDEITKLTETVAVLTGNFNIMEKQREKIEYLEMECEKHMNEKHVTCDRRISELTDECQNNIGFIEAQKNELNVQRSQIDDLSNQLEKNKLEMKSFNFKEFIVLKRELAQLKQDKEKQFATSVSKQQAQPSVSAAPQPLPLPPIKELKQKQPLFKFFH